MARGRVHTLCEVGVLAVVAAASACNRSKQQPTGAPAPAEIRPQPTEAIPAASSEHALIAHLPLSDKKFGTAADLEDCQTLERALEQDIAGAQAGEMDGNEIGGGECTLFMYGPNADRLFDVTSQRIRSSRLAKGGWVTKRYGAAGDVHAKEIRIDL